MKHKWIVTLADGVTEIDVEAHSLEIASGALAFNNYVRVPGWRATVTYGGETVPGPTKYARVTILCLAPREWKRCSLVTPKIGASWSSDDEGDEGDEE